MLPRRGASPTRSHARRATPTAHGTHLSSKPDSLTDSRSEKTIDEMITSIAALGRPRTDFVYEIIGDLAPRLCVDVGAAAGVFTRRMCEALDDDGRVVAFEPFPGNVPYFRAATAGLPNITLFQKAVSERCGTSELFVDSVVLGSERGWEGMNGYSSVGHLCTERLWHLRKLAKRVRRVVRAPRALFDRRKTSLRVETTTLDAEFPSASIDFVKVDVQGAECNVLRGARKLLREQRVGLWYVEWSGDPSVIQAFEQAGYVLFDSMYLGSMYGGMPALRRLGFQVHDEVFLSTGAVAYVLSYTGNPARVGRVLRSVKLMQLGWLQTDLIAVSRALLPRFEQSTRERLAPHRGS
jgi:FkbM family methyltransferase